LPAGVSGYWQTTSWGEWFNVRIVKWVIKDQNGNPVGGAEEDAANRPPAPPAYQCQNFKGRGQGSAEAGDASAAAAGAGSDGQGFGSILGFLGFVLEGSRNG
jgi:hypothetical protein